MYTAVNDSLSAAEILTLRVCSVLGEITPETLDYAQPGGLADYLEAGPAGARGPGPGARGGAAPRRRPPYIMSCRLSSPASFQHHVCLTLVAFFSAIHFS